MFTYNNGWGAFNTNVLTPLVRTNDSRAVSLTNPADVFDGSLVGNATYATNAGTAGTSANVVSGTILTNVVVTNSMFYGNGNGLTNLAQAAVSSRPARW